MNKNEETTMVGSFGDFSMPLDVNYSFLADLEGGCVEDGYVPAHKKSKSGVTISVGFDLGARNKNDLTRIGITGDLLTRLTPYLGLTGKKATDLLEKSPLNISTKECVSIEKAIQANFTAQVSTLYNGAISSNSTKFEDLDAKYQTVILSVAYQYGAGLASRAPKFWKAVTSQNWAETVKVLRDFGDAYKTRRNREADYLEGK